MGGNGSPMYVKASGKPVFDANGEFRGYRGTGADVTEHKRAEQALRRSEVYLAEAQRLSHTGSFGWTPSTGELRWSEEIYSDSRIRPAHRADDRTGAAAHSSRRPGDDASRS